MVRPFQRPLGLAVVLSIAGLVTACGESAPPAGVIAGDEVSAAPPPSGSPPTPAPAASAHDPADGSPPPGDVDDGTPERRACTSSFGSSLATGSFGRIDGTLVAIVQPGNKGCSGDAHHLHLQIAMDGSIYDVAVNIDGVDIAEKDAPLAGDTFSEGWHSDVKLDYPSTLSLRTKDFTTMSVDDVTTRITTALERANHVSIFATKYSKGGVHLVHRNGNSDDGAIVTSPLGTAPHYLVFQFPRQDF